MQNEDKEQNITTTQLVQTLGYDHSNAWKYFTNLVKKGVFVEVVYSNPSIYTIFPVFLLIYDEWKRKEINKVI